MLAPWKKTYDKCIQNQRHYFVDKDPYSQTYSFSSSHVWMWSWTIKKAECQRIEAFKLWCWRRDLRVPWTARRPNKSILKEINPKYSLEELMLKLKLQFFGHLIWKANSLENILMLGKTECGKRREWQRTRWMDGITDSIDMSLRSSGRWWRTGKPSILQSMGLQRAGHFWATEQQQKNKNKIRAYHLVCRLRSCHIWDARFKQEKKSQLLRHLRYFQGDF